MLDNLTKRISGIFAGLRRQGRLSEEDVSTVLREIRVALLEADVNFAVAKQFVARVKEKAVGEEVFSSLSADQTIVKIVRDELIELLGGGDAPFNWSPQPPTVLLLAGLQGSGKTTTSAKLARWLLAQKKKPVLVACDLQRPAAVTQLRVLGEQVGVPVFGPQDVEGGATDPVVVARMGVERCKYLFHDVVILDTAGRLSIDEALMDELKRISEATSPDETFLVLDSTTGQEAVNVAQAFHERLALTGAVFTKLDGDARGGAVLSVRQATGVPVRFIGTGEQTEALDMFHPDRMAGRIIGMGDVLGIIEKAEQVVDVGAAANFESRMKSGKWDFNDLLDQMSMVKKMGPLRNVMKMIPGIAAAVPDEAFDQLDDKLMDRTTAIVLSMTRKERSNPDILNGSRRKRIAVGSGTSAEEVNRVIDSLYMMRRSMKQMGLMQKKAKKFGRR